VEGIGEQLLAAEMVVEGFYLAGLLVPACMAVAKNGPFIACSLLVCCLFVA
jgi:hypothetical protein